MSISKVLLVAVLTALYLVAVPATASDCSGNACDDVTVTWDGTCYNIKNHGTRRVKVHIGDTVSMTLQRGETKQYVWIDGKCTNTMWGKVRANYINS